MEFRGNVLWALLLSGSACLPASAADNRQAEQGRNDAVVQAVAPDVRSIKGKVIDEKGETVIGATIVVKGASAKTVTDFDGNFELKGVDAGAAVEISYIGFQTLTAKLSNGATFVMKEDNKLLNEVVVVGVHARRDERAAEIGAQTELLEVLHTQRREVAQPVLGVLREMRIDAPYNELRDLFRRNALLLQNGPLVHGTAARLRHQLRLLAVELAHRGLLLLLGRLRRFRLVGRVIFGENGRAAVGFNLVLQLVRRGLDRHSGAVEAEREDGVLSLQCMVTTLHSTPRSAYRVANSAFVAVNAWPKCSKPFM